MIRANATGRIGWTPDDNQIWLSLKNKNIASILMASYPRGATLWTLLAQNPRM
ncbi:hypothetical protein M378DRAFT_159910 [Amanita muscaria Koide BX008]|uniref:Uncharacterized protein n=1 Tax=Amanita muscaria (strain Koide BX008) TaxID=946122 RepID=A0A0C2XC76_AMAMK|nr:hypothetical protein M378DRAFT_159910 [Amanita muscaria Koide BX008]